MMKFVETWPSDSRVSYDGVVDHISRQPVILKHNVDWPQLLVLLIIG